MKEKLSNIFFRADTQILIWLVMTQSLVVIGYYILRAPIIDPTCQSAPEFFIALNGVEKIPEFSRRYNEIILHYDTLIACRYSAFFFGASVVTLIAAIIFIRLWLELANQLLSLKNLKNIAAPFALLLGIFLGTDIFYWPSAEIRFSGDSYDRVRGLDYTIWPQNIGFGTVMDSFLLLGIVFCIGVGTTHASIIFKRMTKQ